MASVLVIDDDGDILEILGEIFREFGFEVVLSRGSLTMDHIKIIQPDIILLDIRLVGSEKDGVEMCRELKSEESLADLPVILCSAETDLRSIAKGCGADSYITKPFDIDDLLSRVATYLT